MKKILIILFAFSSLTAFSQEALWLINCTECQCPEGYRKVPYTYTNYLSENGECKDEVRTIFKCLLIKGGVIKKDTVPPPASETVYNIENTYDSRSYDNRTYDQRQYNITYMLERKKADSLKVQFRLYPTAQVMVGYHVQPVTQQNLRYALSAGGKWDFRVLNLPRVSLFGSAQAVYWPAEQYADEAPCGTCVPQDNGLEKIAFNASIGIRWQVLDKRRMALKWYMTTPSWTPSEEYKLNYGLPDKGYTVAIELFRGYSSPFGLDFGVTWPGKAQTAYFNTRATFAMFPSVKKAKTNQVRNPFELPSLDEIEKDSMKVDSTTYNASKDSLLTENDSLLLSLAMQNLPIDTATLLQPDSSYYNKKKFLGANLPRLHLENSSKQNKARTEIINLSKQANKQYNDIVFGDNSLQKKRDLTKTYRKINQLEKKLLRLEGQENSRTLKKQIKASSKNS